MRDLVWTTSIPIPATVCPRTPGVFFPMFVYLVCFRKHITLDYGWKNDEKSKERWKEGLSLVWVECWELIQKVHQAVSQISVLIHKTVRSVSLKTCFSSPPFPKDHLCWRKHSIYVHWFCIFLCLLYGVFTGFFMT